MRVRLDITLPPEELAALLQALRTWEAGRPTIRMVLDVDAPELTTAEIGAMLDRLSPQVQYRLFRTRASSPASGTPARSPRATADRPRGSAC